jgi:hypothetical protein
MPWFSLLDISAHKHFHKDHTRDTPQNVQQSIDTQRWSKSLLRQEFHASPVKPPIIISPFPEVSSLCGIQTISIECCRCFLLPSSESSDGTAKSEVRYFLIINHPSADIFWMTETTLYYQVIDWNRKTWLIFGKRGWKNGKVYYVAQKTVRTILYFYNTCPHVIYCLVT